MTPVQVIRNPTQVPIPGGDVGDHRHEQRAEVVAEGVGGQRQRGAHAPHGIWRLVIVELQLPDEGEDLGRPYDEVLRHLPEYRHGHKVFRVIQVVSRHDAEPDDLDNASCQHREDGDDEADPHSSQLGESPLVASELACQRDDDTVIDRNQHDDTDGVDEREGGGGHFESSHMRLHLLPLEDEHGVHLAVDGGEDHAAGPYREEMHDALQFLDLSHRAERPWTLLALDLVMLSLNCSLVQEPEQETLCRIREVRELNQLDKTRDEDFSVTLTSISLCVRACGYLLSQTPCLQPRTRWTYQQELSRDTS